MEETAKKNSASRARSSDPMAVVRESILIFTRDHGGGGGGSMVAAKEQSSAKIGHVFADETVFRFGAVGSELLAVFLMHEKKLAAGAKKTRKAAKAFTCGPCTPALRGDVCYSCNCPVGKCTHSGPSSGLLSIPKELGR